MLNWFTEHAAGIDRFTRKYILWWVYGLGVLEIFLIVLRRLGVKVRLVSQIAEGVAFRGLPTLAYFLTGLCVHFFMTWRVFPWSSRVTAYTYSVWWAIGAAYLVADIFDPDRMHWPLVTQWLRYPPVVALVGAIGAFLLFPQKSIWYPGFMR